MKRVVALGLLTCIAACNNGFGRHLSVSGQIEGVTVRAGSRTGGRVSEVLVQEGDAVKKGDILVRLEAHEAQARVAA
ncbi:MAG TPA: biotin/lipoyl-binding protein, partial [Candidatus Hydrogenedentes bacterium]|nr:biotin/lipoyl-binding protein [Candidatus Hydrogenedentota bacterium]